jgi:hypothetical protein
MRIWLGIRVVSRAATPTVLFEDVDISAHAGLLTAGHNLLAIRLINSSATSNDIFVQPALVSREVKFGIAPIGDVYYTTDGTDPRGPDGQPLGIARSARSRADHRDQHADHRPQF